MCNNIFRKRKCLKMHVCTSIEYSMFLSYHNNTNNIHACMNPWAYSEKNTSKDFQNADTLNYYYNIIVTVIKLK